MIRLIAADTGAGKTKTLIARANESLKSTNGHIVYLDIDDSHMFDLRHEIRYINVTEYPIQNESEFFGFMCGILSEDADIDEIYIDGLLRLCHIPMDNERVDHLVERLRLLSDKFNVKFIISISADINKLPDDLKDYLMV